MAAAAACSMPTVSSGSDTFLSALPRVVSQFQRKEGRLIAGFAQHITDSGVHFFGIHKKAQMETSTAETVRKYSQFKRELAGTIGLDPETLVVQVIGDSVAYSPEGTARSLKFLETVLATDSLILYGFTGHEESDGTRCVNAATSDIVTSRGFLGRAVGNVVAFHTPTALKSWHCSGPDLKHYVVVYGDDESSKATGTLFGDDVPTSDFISDTFYLLEGGIQSFRQACNALLLGKPIKAISRLRGERSFGMKTDDSFVPYFSTVDFLQYIREKLREKTSTVTDEQLHEWKNEYFKTHFVADSTRPDYSTKSALLEEAWKIFLEDRLYTHLDLFEVTAAISSYVKEAVKPEQATIKRYIITGGPGVGKTTLINHLRDLKGAAIVEEAATRVIKAEFAAGVTTPWADGEKFRAKIIDLQKEDRAAIARSDLAAKSLFFDRSEVDTISYCSYFGATPTPEIARDVADIVSYYNPIVFLVENLGHCERTDVRPESVEEALKIESAIAESYRALGFQIVRIKAGPVEERAAAVFAALAA